MSTSPSPAPSRLAKSRLSSLGSHVKDLTQAAALPSRNLNHWPAWQKKYLKHLPTLMLALPFYLGVGWILTRVAPDKIRNVLFPASFLPLHAALLLGNFFTFSFIFLNSRRGWLVALAVELLIFLKLQSVVISPELIIGLCGVVLGLEALILVLQKLRGGLPRLSRGSGTASSSHKASEKVVELRLPVKK